MSRAAVIAGIGSSVPASVVTNETLAERLGASDDWIRDVADASILPYCIRVAIPRDGEAMLLEDPQRALRWRTSARHAIRWGLEHGYTIDALLTEDGDAQAYYLMTRTPRQHLTLDR